MNKKIFTEEEKNYIIENWGKESAHSMKKKFNCSWYAIVNVALEAGLEKPKSDKWTNDEIDMLKELSKTHHYKDIAKIMSRTPDAIYLKQRKLGIKSITSHSTWTKEDEEYLEENWGTLKLETIAKNLHRTIYSLKVKAIRMNLGSMLDNRDYLSIDDICDIMGVTRDRVTITWVKLGLNIKKKKITNKKSYMQVSLEDLVLFLKEHQNEWDSTKLEPYILGNEDEWLREKREKDRNEKIEFYKKWTNSEKDRAIMYFNQGYSYSEIASKIGRSEYSVTTFLRESGYSYKMKRFWQGREIKYLRENYQSKTYKEIGEVLGRTEKAVSYKAAELGFRKKLTLKKD